MKWSVLTALVLLPFVTASCGEKTLLFSSDDARAIAKEAYIYGYPMVEAYRIMCAYALEDSNPEFKAPLNQIANIPRAYTPADSAVQTPNSDTPYSMVWADLRGEGLVLSVPKVPEQRYYSVQFIDLYTQNFAYVGSRPTGNEAGKYLLVGPRWFDTVPEGIDKVFRSETEFAFLVYRTQLFNPFDIERVKRVQRGYTVETVSAHTGTNAPATAPVNFPAYDAAKAASLGFFGYLNFLLTFCPTHPTEDALRARFAKIGVGPGEGFDADALSDRIRDAVEAGLAEGKAAIEATVESADASVASSDDYFGTREMLGEDYVIKRAAAARLGIFGNNRAEALYPAYQRDNRGLPLDGSKHRYTLRFEKGKRPPVNAFWSVTMYDAISQLLVDNVRNRYLINSAMADTLSLAPDSSLTIHIQHRTPPWRYYKNWLPAPNGPFYVIMRLYWPQPEALDGTWKPPTIERVE